MRIRLTLTYEIDICCANSQVRFVIALNTWYSMMMTMLRPVRAAGGPARAQPQQHLGGRRRRSRTVQLLLVPGLGLNDSATRVYKLSTLILIATAARQ